MEREPDWIDELKRQTLEREDPWVVLEGREAVEAAMAGWWDISGILAADSCDWEPPAWSGLELVRRPMELLDEIMNGSLHGGVLGLTRQPDETADVAGLMTELDEDALIIVCPRLEDVGQVGSIIRNAAALGAKAVVFGREGASPFERGSVRASSGAIFRLPLRVADGGQILRCLKTAGFQLIGGTEGEKCVSLSRLELEPGRHALVVGSHVTGLGSFWKAACDTLVKVPSESNDETLDSAAASAVLLWEIARCRREQAENEG